jgi:hypothetical protein
MHKIAHDGRPSLLQAIEAVKSDSAKLAIGSKTVKLRTVPTIQHVEEIIRRVRRASTSAMPVRLKMSSATVAVRKAAIDTLKSNMPIYFTPILAQPVKGIKGRNTGSCTEHRWQLSQEHTARLFQCDTKKCEYPEVALKPTCCEILTNISFDGLLHGVSAVEGTMLHKSPDGKSCTVSKSLAKGIEIVYTIKLINSFQADNATNQEVQLEVGRVFIDDTLRFRESLDTQLITLAANCPPQTAGNSVCAPSRSLLFVSEENYKQNTHTTNAVDAQMQSTPEGCLAFTMHPNNDVAKSYSGYKKIVSLGTLQQGHLLVQGDSVHIKHPCINNAETTELNGLVQSSTNAAILLTACK